MSSLENEALAMRRREEILRAARFCFGEKGFSATKMKDIAARLQMSVGNLYNYFKSKDEIVRTLAQRQIDNLVKKIRETDYEDREQNIQDLAEIALTRLNLRSAVFALDVMNAATSNRTLAHILHYHDRACREALLAIYKEKNVENPELRLECDMCLLDGLIIRIIANPSLDTKKLARAVAERIVRH